MSPIPLSVRDPRDRSRDKALLIALQYGDGTKQGSQSTVPRLSTPHRDADALEDHLVKREGYPKQNVTVIKDDERAHPTKATIEAAIDAFMEDVQSGDRRVFFFAGHGYQIVSRTGTEDDNKDEVILIDKSCGEPVSSTGRRKTLDPSMLKEGDPDRKKLDGIITDNYLREKLVDCLPPGARLVAIFDTCHSGTMLDLDYHWKWKHFPRRSSRTGSCHKFSLDTTAAPTSPVKAPVKASSLPANPVRAAANRPVWAAARAYGKFMRSVKRRSTVQAAAADSSAKPLALSTDVQSVTDRPQYCSSPVSEVKPSLPISKDPSFGPIGAEVLSLSSAMDSQLAWGREHTMLSVLLDVLRGSEKGTRPKVIKIMESVQSKTSAIRVAAIEQNRQQPCTKSRRTKIQEAQCHQFGSLSPWQSEREFMF